VCWIPWTSCPCLFLGICVDNKSVRAVSGLSMLEPQSTFTLFLGVLSPGPGMISFRRLFALEEPVSSTMREKRRVLALDSPTLLSGHTVLDFSYHLSRLSLTKLPTFGPLQLKPTSPTSFQLAELGLEPTLRHRPSEQARNQDTPPNISPLLVVPSSVAYSCLSHLRFVSQP
jgi:hypothetical protein